ncbi:hypothetical protein K1X76_10660 [bacterium]|nr:hypothetical protein [bacterium]
MSPPVSFLRPGTTIPDFSFKLADRRAPSIQLNLPQLPDMPVEQHLDEEEAVPALPPPPAEEDTSPDISLTVGGFVEGYIAGHWSDEPFNAPFSGAGTFYTTLNANNLAGGKVDVTASFKLMMGIDSFRGDEGTILGGPYDRLKYARSRFNVYKDNIGIPKLSLAVKYNPIGLSFFGGVLAQDDNVYPYNFNSTVFSDGTTLYTSRNSFFDGPNWATLWLIKYGYQLGFAYEPPQVAGLRVALTSGPDGGFAGSRSWAINPQVGYTWGYEAGKYHLTKASTSINLFGMDITPDTGPDRLNSNGEHVGDKGGLGFTFGQTLGPLTLGAGFSFNRQEIKSDELGSVITTGTGADVTASYQVHDLATVTAGYTYYGVKDKAVRTPGDKPLYSDFAVTHGFELAAVAHIPKAPGFGIYAGYAAQLVDGSHEVSSLSSGNQHTLSLGLQYGGSHVFNFNR